MVKKANRTYSEYSLEAMKFLGRTIRAERKLKKITEAELAERAGVSRSVIQRIEKGDMACGIGIVFEAAHILSIPIFDATLNSLSNKNEQIIEKLTLLPKAIHKKRKVINDDF